MKRNLTEILNGLSLDEKIGQLVQLPAEFLIEGSSTTSTGPSSKLGLADDYDVKMTGSVLNAVDANLMRKLQSKNLEESSHKIPLLFMADIIYGYKTVFPIPLAQAASFDFEAIEKAASIVAKEAYYDGHHVTFSPMVDLVRDPRWGRVMESFGEDVYVGKEFAKASVRGFQGINDKVGEEKLAACVKHFAAYGAPIAGREYAAVDMSEQQLREVYLPSYKAAIDANVKLVMTAFNTLNGVPATGNKWLNRDILRDEFGFEGVLISDYAAIAELVQHGFAKDDSEAAKIALEVGVDIDMKTSIYTNNLKELINSGDLDIAYLDEAVLRILELKEDLGLFENPYRGMDENKDLELEASKQHAIDLASKSSVLLKNNNVLPLDKSKKISLVGPFVDSPAIVGMWAFTADPGLIVSLRKSMLSTFPEENLSFSMGSNILSDYTRMGFSDNIGDISKMFPVMDQKKLIAEAIENSKDSDVIVLAIGEAMMESGEGGSKTQIRISPEQKELIREMKKLNKKMVAVVYAGRPLVLSDVIDDFDAVLYAWYPGTYGNLAVSKILSGEINPSGKLPMTFPKNEGQIPVYYSTYRSGRPISNEDAYYRFTSRYIDETNRPLFEFGYGLSYTDFKINNIKVDKKEFTEDSMPIITVDVENVGKNVGTEVVQLYIRDDVAKISRPKLELKAVKRVELEPNEKKTIMFALSKEDLSYIDSEGKRVLDAGTFTVFVGNSSEKISESVIIELM